MKPILSLPALAMLAACSSSGGSDSGPMPVNTAVDLAIVPDSSALLEDSTAQVTAPAVQIETPQVANDSDASFARLLNGVRAGNGLDGVSIDSRLDAAAQAHADDMSRNVYFSHTGQNGSTVLQRITDAGYDPRAYGEAIAGNIPTQEAALDAWINSPSHNEILNGAPFEDFGFGFAGRGDRTRWVLLMGAE
ncbi:CAP domain-containing protein [Yoonia sp. 208BN28-4]|uniref:CAP domain-containing protein n=1 Tax=Yoonia sp. 208BN28-4 TaxID=3126505 RepID=UPI0030AAC519